MDLSNQAIIAKPKRWDNPYDAGLSTNDVESILTLAPFVEMDPARFPDQTPLREILLNDTRKINLEDCEVAFKEGDYGNSLFFILKGCVHLLPSGQFGGHVKPKAPSRKTLIRSLGQLFLNPTEPEVRSIENYGATHEELTVRQEEGGVVRSFLPYVADPVPGSSTRVAMKGQFFGELSALNRSPRSRTAISVSSGTELLEIRWQGVRELMQGHPLLKEQMLKLYRENAVMPFLKKLDLFKPCSPQLLEKMAAQIEFTTYGDYDWSGEYKKLLREDNAAHTSEPVIIHEGDYVDRLAIVRAGFARVSEKVSANKKTVSYLREGMMFGLDDLDRKAAGKVDGKNIGYAHSLSAVGYAHILFVPSVLVEQLLKGESGGEMSSLTFNTPDRSGPKEIKMKEGQGALGEFFAERRYLNGTATMLIDLDRCTRCDDCVRACAATHNNNPRFVRHGPVIENVMVANACMHCVDPVCLLGCPTGAIHRHADDGQVVINDQTCIGCGACANNCPYDAIRMVDIRDGKGRPVINTEGFPVVKASKCDLCVDQAGGPACFHACPHDALRRVDMQEVEEISKWLKA